MQSLKKYYFGKQKAKVNTFIGGIGGTINTPALLASKLGISENRIKLFKVTGVDVECAIIGGSYVIPNNAFSNFNSQFPNVLTYYIDSGLVTGIDNCFFGQTNVLRFDFLNVINVGQNTFYNTKANRYYIPKCTSLGTPLNNGIFFGIDANSKIYLNDVIRTINSGSEDGDVVAARSLGAIIRYVTDFTKPNAVTNLSVGLIYNTAVQLNFTPPAVSANPIDFYECYANGKLQNEITASGQFITGLTPSTNYNITVVAVDIFYNKSVVSNVVNVSTFYNNSADSDATNYTNISSNSSFSSAIQLLFVDLKNTGLYFKIQAFYPFLGTTQAQHKWNAKNPQDTNAAFRLVFSGGGTHSNLGYQCNGTNAYANTFFAPSSVQNVNSNGLTVVVGTNNATTQNDVVEIGSFNSVTQASILTSKSNNTTFRRQSRMNGESVLQDNQNDAKGIFTAVRQSATVSKLFRNSTQIASGNSGGNLPTQNIFIGNLNINGTAYASGWSNQRVQFVAIHEGLTDTEVQTLHTIIDAFETAIGRKTW